MNTLSRGMQFIWLMGFLLLLGTILGAGWVFNQPVTGNSSPVVQDPAEFGVIGLGYVDVPGGTTFLHPVRAGRVETVWVTEGDEVLPGAMLLSLDSSAARAKLHEAQIGLDAALQQLVDAEKGRKSHEHDVNSLAFKLEAKRAELEAASKERDLFRDLQKSTGNISNTQVAMYEAKVKAVDNELKAMDEQLKKLKEVDLDGKIKLANLNVQAKKAERDLAQIAYYECDLYAPTGGVVLRLFATPGDILSTQSKQPAVHFCPDVPRVVRVEILQEWASKVKEGQLAIIEDDTSHGSLWKGKVERVSGQMTQRRSLLQEPFQYNDVRTLECIVAIDPGGAPVRIGQRMRVTIKQGGL